MMLLDEPTSNLDSLNEAVILKSLHEERNGKTIVLVSHRKSSMRMVDRVYSGKRKDELMKDKESKMSAEKYSQREQEKRLSPYDWFVL